jgi:putative nucleotidyltransferase with HDIG domain
MRLLSWPLSHIRWKIILPYVLLTAILALVGSYVATNLVTGSLTERFDNQLAEAGRVMSDSVVEKEREHLESVRTIAFTTGVATAVSAGDSAALDTLVRPIAANRGVERVEILDVSGRRLEAMRLANRQTLDYQPLTDTDQPSTWPLVQSVLQSESDQLGDKQAQIVDTAEGYILYTAGPISENGYLVGVVLVGTSLDSFVAQSKLSALADVTAYDFNGVPIASTFDRSSAVSPEELSLDAQPDVATQVAQGSVIREQRIFFGRGYDLVYGRLLVRNQVVGLYSVGLPTNFIYSAGSTTRLQIVVLFTLGMAAVLAIGFYLTQRLTSPILRLVRTARLVASGDLTARSGVHVADEIGVLATSFDDMTSRLQRQHLSTIKALTSAIDARDPYTLGHSVRVGQLSMMIGRELGLDDSSLARLEIGGYLHDIGKIGIRDAVLLKPGRLTDEERRAIEEHPRIGLEILDAVELPLEVIQFVAGHHERLDGTGYPKRLRGSEVPMVARIGAVADMYDAVTTSRPYRDPMKPEEALRLLESEAPRLLDPQVVQAFRAVIHDWEARRKTEQALKGIKLSSSSKAIV